MTEEAANDNLSQLHRLRARAARILRPKEAQAVADTPIPGQQGLTIRSTSREEPPKE